ncbi:MAG: family 43 glycosylhydrolase [Meiothermus silvanus]|nr:family 43 glycosylhydrolase [Allomeiothermus silvanus]
MPPRVPLYRVPARQPNPEKPRSYGRLGEIPTLLPGSITPSAIYHNPVLSDAKGQDHGDPFVMEYLGSYYLYHTGREGVRLYTSSDLVSWHYQGIVLGPEPGHWAEIDFWAPEVMYHEGVFYMYVAATRRKEDGKGDDKLRRLGVARALRPEGPFVWNPEPIVGWEWSIDGHPYRDEDGSLWFFYNIRTEATRYHDGTIGCGNVVSRMISPEEVERTQHPVAYPSHRWEGNRRGNWYWNEGPCVLKRRGIYFQMYSGGCYADDTYGLGFTTASTPQGPWHKQSRVPILKSSKAILGPGHHSIVTGPDGVTPYVVYHGYLPGTRGRKVHLDRIFWAGDRPVVEGPTRTQQPRPRGPVYDPRVPHYNFSAWVFGRQVRIGGVLLLLSGSGYQHLRVIRRDLPSNGPMAVSWLKVYLNGVVKFDGAVTKASPSAELEVDGEIHHPLQTSWLDDEQIYPLSAGEKQAWMWGGSGDLEVSLAVHGHALIRVDEEEFEVNHERYELIRLWIEGGANGLEVEGLGRGASVTDVVMTARSL